MTRELNDKKRREAVTTILSIERKLIRALNGKPLRGLRNLIPPVDDGKPQDEWRGARIRKQHIDAWFDVAADDTLADGKHLCLSTTGALVTVTIVNDTVIQAPVSPEDLRFEDLPMLQRALIEVLGRHLALSDRADRHATLKFLLGLIAQDPDL